jgi:hypothetical protein
VLETRTFTANVLERPDWAITLIFAIRGDASVPEDMSVGTVISLSCDPETAYEPAVLTCRQRILLAHTYPNGWQLHGLLTWTDRLVTIDAFQIVGFLEVVLPDGRVWHYEGYVTEFGHREDQWPTDPPEPPEIPPPPGYD